MSGDPRPIGIFDSGIGGLTVLKVLRQRFPNEHFVYLGDTARLPYGSKSPQTIRRYAEQNVAFLASQGVKLIVIACNSASTQMRESRFLNLPVYNVINPGARTALAASAGKVIGLIGTRATVSSGAYEAEIKALDPQATVVSQACPLLVPLAEEGWDQDPVTNIIVFRYLQSLMTQNIDTLILGCTHYPLLAGSIARVTGSSVALVDSGEAIAAVMQEDLKSGSWAANDAGPGTVKLMVTDGSTAFHHLSHRILDEDSIHLQIVNITPETVTSS